MLDALKSLFESTAISEEVKAELQEAWETKVRENRQQVTAELREEFAQKYEHDKQTMVEAIDQMLSERLAEEIQEFADDRKQLAEAKAKYSMAMRENAKTLKSFVMEQLKSEVAELHEDKKAQAEKFAKLEEFVVDALAHEIAEFYEDKKDLSETKVRLVREAKVHFGKVKKDFIERSAKAVSETVDGALRGEIGQLKEDIEEARRNDFGRKVFEAFASEYSNSYLNEKGETVKLMKLINSQKKQIEEAKKVATKANTLVESQQKQYKKLQESTRRKEIMSNLVAPLNRDQKEIMSDLLEGVQTDRLRVSFDKYLPSVIDGNKRVPQGRKAVLSEGKEVTGNKATTQNDTAKADDSNVLELRRLAGLK
jgi:hypothetical protein